MGKKTLGEDLFQKFIGKHEEEVKSNFLKTVKSVLKELDILWETTAIVLPRKVRFKKDIYLLAQAQYGMTRSGKYLRELYERVDKHPEILK